MIATTENTKERLIQCGMQLIGEKSYHGAGLSEILKTAEVPKGSFYHYFKSKEDFAVSVVERSSEQHMEHMKQFLSDRSLKPLERIYGYFEMLRSHYRENGAKRTCLVAKLALEVCQLSPLLRAAVKSTYDQWAVILAQTVREAQAAGAICEMHDPDALASVLINSWEGATIRMQIEGHIKPLDDFFQVVIEEGLKLKPCHSESK
ncbi:MAG: TetR family transcriptional regulator C-terminal domain-containing protein [Verrucomicrobiota bacterium]